MTWSNAYTFVYLLSPMSGRADGRVGSGKNLVWAVGVQSHIVTLI